MLRDKEGITLISLVVTVIILLILAGISIATLTGENGLITQAMKAKEKTEQSAKNEEALLEDLEDYINGNIVTEEGYDEEGQVNKPNIKAGMIPVYYDGTTWRKADETNQDEEHKWYDYSEEEKQWANIVTVAEEDKSLREAKVGTEIPMEKITTFFVWVPRYAYSITRGYKEGNEGTGEIDVTFLKGNTNTGTDNVEYRTDYDETKLSKGDTTPKIVHPAFKLGNTQLTGIWVAKFEASGLNASGKAVGNADADEGTDNITGYNPITSDNSTYVRILPNQPSWRQITIGESQYQSMQMSANTEKYGWTEGVNSHLMKNSEWGAVAYLCYSQYGEVPKINSTGSYINISITTEQSDGSTKTSSSSWYYNMYTGAGPISGGDEGIQGRNISRKITKDKTGAITSQSTTNQTGTAYNEEVNGYNTTNGNLASTTGNIYGIYDMNGGAWERVATYLDNNNGNLNSYGQSTTRNEENQTIKYIENGKLNSKYSSLWETYTVSNEEKNSAGSTGEIEVQGVGKITQGSLWNWNNKSTAYNTARKRLTEATFKNMEKVKGIGVNEVNDKCSYYAPYGSNSNSQNWGCFQTAKDTSTNTTQEYVRTWDGDYTLIGHASSPFVMRGGNCDNGSGAGVLYTYAADGNANNHNGFRPVLAF